MKKLFVMLSIVVLLGLPLAVWADPDDQYQYFEQYFDQYFDQYFEPETGTAETSVSTDSAVEEAVSTTGVESDSAASDAAENPREPMGDETFIE